MKVFHSLYPRRLLSEFGGPRLLNFAGEPDEQGAASQPDGADEPNPNTPAGKKWAALKQEKKEALEKARIAEEARIRAEARAEAMEEFKNSLSGKKPEQEQIEEAPDDDDKDVNPEDEKIINKVLAKQMKRMGLDTIPEVVNALKENTEQMQASVQFEKAKTELSEEFANTVPFDYQAALEYAKEKGFGLYASTAKDALRMAHKEMNEEAFIEHWRGGKSPKKVVPKMGHSGRSNADDDLIDLDPKKADDVTIDNFESARQMAREAMEIED